VVKTVFNCIENFEIDPLPGILNTGFQFLCSGFQIWCSRIEIWCTGNEIWCTEFRFGVQDFRFGAPNLKSGVQNLKSGSQELKDCVQDYKSEQPPVFAASMLLEAFCGAVGLTDENIKGTTNSEQLPFIEATHR
jgi:hypothetical protein